MSLSIDSDKAFDRNPTPISHKNPSETGHRGNLPQHNKGHIWQTHHSQWWKAERIHAEIRNKTRMSALVITLQHSFGSPSHGNQRSKRNKRNPNWKGRIKTIPICRWHDTIPRESVRLYQKTVRAHSQIWQSRRIQNHYTEINGISIY